VTDRGPGLGPVAADEIFGETARASGRALVLARDLLRRNGGDLTLRNRIGGATFVLSLPAAGVAPAPRSPEDRTHVERRVPRLSASA
jgi:signal transduction histidine kinase